MNLNDYASYVALGLAELVRNKHVSATELRDCGMQAIELVNPSINAIVATTPEEAAASVCEARSRYPSLACPS